MGMAFLGMIGPFSKMTPSHTSMKKQQEWCVNNFPSFIERDRWPPNNPDLNLSDYWLWNELGKTIIWNGITSKKSLIVALKRGVKEVLCLRVARLEPIDHIACHKMREII